MNLLDDPVFTVQTTDGTERCSLPRIYALLGRDEVEAFSKLQAHQKQAWHCFLAQLGAIAAEERGIPESEAEWREALDALAVRQAWNVYTEKLTEPAFMQPPVPEETLDGFQNIHPTEYDVPVLSKNHALKLHRLHEPSDEHWLYLLVNVQTTGFYSPGGRRASRMNGSYASRPFFGLTPSLRLGPWIMHDVQVLNRYVSEIEKRYGYQREVSPLLWTQSWNGSKSFDLEELHPLYIDCARRIRQGPDGTWQKKKTSTERVTGDINGQTGDPWAPVNQAENKVLNPGRAAFEYRQLSEILFGKDYRLPISFRDATDGYVVCRAVTGEQGGRVNDLQRVIEFSTTDDEDPYNDSEHSVIATEAKQRIEAAEEAAEILSHALYLMLKDDDKDRVLDQLQKGKNRQLEAFHSRVDERFFEKLFQAPVLDDDVRQTFWHTFLVDALHAQMDEARSLCPAKDRWKRLGRAQSVMENRIRTTLTHAKQIDKTDGNGEDEHAGREHAGDRVGREEASEHDAEAVQSV